MKKALFIALHIVAFAVGIAGARYAMAETNVLIYTQSKHFNGDPQYDYNETNPTLGVEYFPADSKLGYTAAVYEDSYRTVAKYAGAIWSAKRRQWRYGATIGIAQSPSYHYKGDYGHIIPFAIPYLAFTDGRFGLNILIAPKADSGGASIVVIQYKVRVDL